MACQFLLRLEKSDRESQITKQSVLLKLTMKKVFGQISIERVYLVKIN
jgi:hypothetical protein